MLDSVALAAEGPSTFVDASGWFLENVWIIAAIPALSFFVILFFGKRLPFKGAEVGITAVGVAFALAVLTGVQWIGEVDAAKDSLKEGSGAEAALVVDDPLEFAAGDTLAIGAIEEVALAEEGGEKEEKVGVRAVTNTMTWWANGGVTFTVGTMVDGLTVLMLFVVTAISLLVHIYSTDYVAGDRRYTHYYAFLSLFTASMLFFVMSENVLQMIVGWELVGVCSFALIGHWWEEKPNSDAALKAFLTNRVGDMGLLIGMIILFWSAGSWSIIDINTQAVEGVIGHNTLLIASLCLTAAVMSKSGQFVLHTWLPDAMAGPTPVSALIHAATMVVAGVYLVARLYGVFWDGYSIAGSSFNLLALIGAITLVGAGLLAFVQDDIKKVLAYSTVSQLGYMVMALGVGAWMAAIFHLFTHAFFKAGLFLGSGSVAHSVHSFNMKTHMGGMGKFMPKTKWTFIICSVALMGIPPLAGFWSKDEILVGTGGWGFFGGTDANGTYVFALVMGIMGAALTCAYMTRCIYLTFYGEWRGAEHMHHDDHAHAAAHDDHHDTAHADHHDDHHDTHANEPHESGPRILVPLYILSGMAIIAGVFQLPPGFITGETESWHERMFVYVEPTAEYFPIIKHGIPSYSLAIFATFVALIGIAASYWYYFVKVNAQSPAATELANGLTKRNPLAKAGHTLLVNKYYLDHLYTDIIARGTKGPIADAAYWTNQHGIDALVDQAGKQTVTAAHFVYDKIDQGVVDGVVNLSGTASEGLGEASRSMLQRGKVQQYAAIMFAAATILAGLFMVFI
jgi:NADH-quinone oxidoreductase subunit L